MASRSALTFEVPPTRAAELSGRRGVVQFLKLPARRCVMVAGEGPTGEAAFAPRMPGLYATATGSDSAGLPQGG